MMNMNVCKDCKFLAFFGCNRLVVSGGFGMSDRVASDYMKGEHCAYFEQATTDSKTSSDRGTRPNFNNS